MKKTEKTAAVLKENAAATVNVNTVNNVTNNESANNAATTDNAANVAKLSPVEIVSLSAAWIKQYGTVSAIRADYAALVGQYGKDNFAAVLANCKTIRAAEIKNAAAILEKDVFTFDGIAAAVFAAVAKSAGYIDLCKFAKKEYDTTDNAKAAHAVIKDFFANVDEKGAPLAKLNSINASGTEIYTTFEEKKLTFSNAVSILKSSLDGMKAAATNAATRKETTDNNASRRANVRTIGKIVAIYAAALDENNNASKGERRDTSKDERTKKAAAALIGNSLPVGCVPVTTWNAAASGNEDAAAAVDDAKKAAKDAAARRA